MPWISRTTSFLLALGLSATLVSAQGVTRLEFSFSSPGARAMGLGGAFIGLADDATAAYANPAGLVQLTRPEVSIEGRTWSHETPFTAGGRAFGLPTGIGIDTLPGLRTAVSSEDVSGISFLSLVYPFRRWSLALYRHQLANFASTFVTDGLFAGPSGGTTARLPDARSLSRLDHTSYGLAAAYRISESLSVGLGLYSLEGAIEIFEETFLPDDDSLEAFFGPNSFLPERLIGSTEVVSADTDWALLGGFLWRLSRSLTLGGIYRQGPVLTADAIATAGPAFDPNVPPGSTLRFTTPLKTPDVFGLGLAARFRSDALILALDWVRVEYSDIVDGLNPDLFETPPLIDDADELHLGAEYLFLQATPLVALRAGAWLDPDHRFRAPPGAPDPFDPVLYFAGDDEIHFAAGLGLAFRTFQLDLGVDFSELVDTISISAIYQF